MVKWKKKEKKKAINDAENHSEFINTFVFLVFPYSETHLLLSKCKQDELKIIRINYCILYLFYLTLRLVKTNL